MGKETAKKGLFNFKGLRIQARLRKAFNAIRSNEKLTSCFKTI